MADPPDAPGRAHLLWGAGRANLASESGFQRASNTAFSGRLQAGVVVPRWGGYLAYSRTVDTNDENLLNPPRLERWVQQDAEAGVLYQWKQADHATMDAGLGVGFGASFAWLSSRPACQTTWQMFPLLLDTACRESAPMASSADDSTAERLDGKALGAHPSVLGHLGLHNGPFVGLRLSGAYYLPWGQAAPSFLMRHDGMLVVGFSIR